MAQCHALHLHQGVSGGENFLLKMYKKQVALSCTPVSRNIKESPPICQNFG